ncbi:MAG: sensor histidine kinase [Desulfobacterales bacterium]|nr:sensor histidine kinase [Desulfobacterales bacterium]
MGFQLKRKRIVTCLALTGVFNTVIALFLTSLGFGGGLPVNFVFSQSIGLCMCSFILAGHFLLRSPSTSGHLVLFLVAMPAGAAAGTFIGALIAGVPLSEIFNGRPAIFIQMLFVGILFGTIVTYFFFSRERISQTEAQLQEEQIRRLTLEKKTLETNLRLLQAQIEPHFLFNTLSNVLSLLESDPGRGKAMLEDFTRYLRSSLSRTRDRTTTLGQEMDLVRAYLEIHRVRMGERLHYTMEIPADLRGRSFPPMLVQPLVENAVKHGLEPKIEGGAISIKVEETRDRLRLAVADTGSGFSGQRGTGIGLANVRERLEALYDGRGKLILEENRPSGLKVIMEIPHEPGESDHSR